MQNGEIPRLGQRPHVVVVKDVVVVLHEERVERNAPKVNHPKRCKANRGIPEGGHNGDALRIGRLIAIRSVCGGDSQQDARSK